MAIFHEIELCKEWSVNKRRSKQVVSISRPLRQQNNKQATYAVAHLLLKSPSRLHSTTMHLWQIRLHDFVGIREALVHPNVLFHKENAVKCRLFPNRFLSKRSTRVKCFNAIYSWYSMATAKLQQLKHHIPTWSSHSNGSAVLVVSLN